MNVNNNAAVDKKLLQQYSLLVLYSFLQPRIEEIFKTYIQTNFSVQIRLMGNLNALFKDGGILKEYSYFNQLKFVRSDSDFSAS